MPHVLDGMSVSVPGAGASNAKKKKKVKCDWKVCETTHDKKVAYANDGVLTRSSGFASAWVAADLEPWKKYGSGKNSFPTLAEYREETPKAAYAVAAAAMKHPEYHTQKHHLISINLFKNVPKLKHNATLVSYDVNAVPNGVCLPTYELDIVRHNLQAHRGSHPTNLYNSKIQPLLKDLEKSSLKYCQPDTAGDGQGQKKLVAALDRMSKTIERRIKAWKWLLRSNALAERKGAEARLAALKGRKT